MLSNETQIPLTVIGGFLGAGKTSYLNALIRDGIPDDSLLVVNDFGDINIDAELIDYRDDRILQLSNGCVCCTLGGTLAERLAAALRLHRRPSAIFIEASGVADPARIADIARVSRRLSLKATVCVLDASQARRHAADALTGDIWRAQIVAASRLLLNRLPPADSVQRSALLTWMRQFHPGLEPEVMPERGEEREGEGVVAEAPPVKGSASGESHMRPPRWTAASVTLPEPVDAAWLEATLQRYADVLLRAKGFVARQDRAGVQVVQFSGGRLAWQATSRVHGTCQLVCIGREGQRFDTLLDSLRRRSVMAG